MEPSEPISIDLNRHIPPQQTTAREVFEEYGPLVETHRILSLLCTDSMLRAPLSERFTLFEKGRKEAGAIIIETTVCDSKWYQSGIKKPPVSTRGLSLF